MKLLITGSGGQIGKALVEQLKLCDNLDFLALNKKTLSITDKQAVQEVVTEFAPNVIINAAAYTQVDDAEKDSKLAHQVNVEGPDYLAQAAEKNKAALLHLSTDYVFSGQKKTPYSEKDTPKPINLYGKTKLEGEQKALKVCSKTVIVRLAWVFGRDGSNFVKTMLRLGKERAELNIVKDQLGGPTYAGDIAKSLLMISRQIVSPQFSQWGIYHYAGTPYVSWYEFAQVIFSKAKEQGVLASIPNLSGISTQQYLTSAIRPLNSRLNTDLMAEVFSIKACDWQSALSDLSIYV